MNEIREFFNILLLSVSLSTALITIISFILFKFRYSYTKKNEKPPHKLDGSFFTRYAPLLKDVNDEFLAVKNDVKEVSLSPQKKILLSFGGIFAFILILLSAENYISFRKSLRTEQVKTQTLRELISDGMLNKTTFNPLKTNASFDEVISPHSQSLHQQVLSHLNEANVVIVVDRRNERLRKRFKVAVQAWRDLFKRHEIKYSLKGISQLRPGELVVIPQMSFMSSAQRRTLTQLLGKSYLVFTGHPALYNADEKKIETNFLTQLTGVKFVKNLKPEVYLPTQLLGKRGLPPGLVLNVYPSDNSLVPKRGSYDETMSLARQSGHDGEPIDLAHRDLMTPDQLSWLAIDPTNERSFYSDLYFLTKLHQTIQKPLFNIANWKDASNKGALSVNIDAEDKFYRIVSFLDLLEEIDTKGSFYLVSDLMNEYEEIDLKKWADSFEFGSHTRDHISMLEKNLKDQFDDLEVSRFDIEVKVHRSVTGIRPPKEEIDSEALSAVVQNEFEYVYGPNTGKRFSPMLIANAQLVVIPRTLADDFQHQRNNFITNRELLYQALIEDYEWIISANGGHFLSLHTHIAGKPEQFKTYKRFLTDIEKEGLWHATNDELSKWWRKRSFLEIKKLKDAYIVKNNGGRRVENFDVLIHGEIPTQCSRNSQKINEVHVMRISSIKPQEELELCPQLNN